MKKLKFYIILAVFFAALGGLIKLQSNKIKAQKAEIERVSNNYRIASDSAKIIQGANGLLSSRIESQSLTIDELKSYYSNIADDIQDMKIQLRKVTGITAFNTETTNNINTIFKDTIVSDTVRLQTLSYHTEWIDLDIIKDGLKAKVNIISRDSLMQVVHWSRAGKFWPTRFMTKKVYEQDIKSMNPDSKIVYSKWILPVKR